MPGWGPCVIRQFLTSIYFVHGSIYMFMLLSPLGKGREAQEGGDICVIMAESLCCMT